MDTLTFISEMTKALAWPFGVVVVGLIYRGQLRNLLDGIKLSRMQKGDWIAEFESVAREVRAELPKATRTEPALLSRTLPSEIEGLVEIAPVEAVLRAWNQIEGRVLDTSKEVGILTNNFPEALRGLVNSGLLDESTKDSVLGLRTLRNLAVHSRTPLSSRQALEFVTMSEAALWSFDENIKTSKKKK